MLSTQQTQQVECRCCRQQFPRGEACLLGGAYYCVVCFALLDHGQAARLCSAHGETRARAGTA